MRVLYVSHTSVVGGGERSLLDLLDAFDATVSPEVACPEGALAVAVRGLDVPVHALPGFDVSFRLHPASTPRGLARMCTAAITLRRIAREQGVDLIHANSIRAGLMAAPLAALGGPPLVVHVRDCLPFGGIAGLARRVVRSTAAVVVANSAYTARSFAPNGLRLPLLAVHSPVDLNRFDPARVDRRDARNNLRLGLDDVVIGVVGQISPWKAQDDAILALAEIRARGIDAQLLVVGAPKFISGAERYDNEAFLRSLHQLVDELGLREAVRFLGDREDVPEILRALDLLLVPSWEEPFGRAVIEAMAMQLPLIATCVGGPAEIVRDGEDGVLLPPRQPRRWGEEAARLLSDPKLRGAMGRRGRATVESRFTRERHAKAVLTAYRQAIGGGRL
jgi:glycosyltransferase involved in cell wall biosynthesis